MHTKSVATHDGILRATILAYINTIRTYKMLNNHTQWGPHSEHTKNTLPQKINYILACKHTSTLLYNAMILSNVNIHRTRI